MYYVYVLQSIKDNKLYIGHTNDLKRRIKEHNSGFTLSTRYRKPFKLIYYESYVNLNDALEKEKFLKTGWGKNYLKRTLKFYFKRQK